MSARRARKAAAGKKQAFNGHRNLSRRQNTGPECVLSVRWIILLPLQLLPLVHSPPGGGWEALIREQEIIEIYFCLERASRKDQGLNNVSAFEAFNFLFNIEI